MESAFDPGGALLATANGVGGARVWDVASGLERSVLRHGDLRHGDDVSWCAFSPMGSLLVTAADVRFERRYSVRLWRQIESRRTPPDHDREPRLLWRRHRYHAAAQAARRSARRRHSTGHSPETLWCRHRPSRHLMGTRKRSGKRAAARATAARAGGRLAPDRTSKRVAATRPNERLASRADAAAGPISSRATGVVRDPAWPGRHGFRRRQVAPGLVCRPAGAGRGGSGGGCGGGGQCRVHRLRAPHRRARRIGPRAGLRPSP